MDASLQQKDKEINQLKKELDKKDFNVNLLSEHINSLRDTVIVVQQKSEEQQQVIDKQDVSLNEVFYVIDTKAELINRGVLEQSGKIIKKTKINFAGIDKAFLEKADKRDLKSVQIKGKSPKILSDVPKDTYTLAQTGETYTLTINKPDKFWSANNRILVIQVK